MSQKHRVVDAFLDLFDSILHARRALRGLRRALRAATRRR